MFSSSFVRCAGLIEFIENLSNNNNDRGVNNLEQVKVTQINGVPKQTYNQSYTKLMETMRLMDQRISSKADGVVLTITSAHRKEIESLQQEVTKIYTILEDLQETNIQRVHSIPFKRRKRNKSWFKLLPFVQKS